MRTSIIKVTFFAIYLIFQGNLFASEITVTTPRLNLEVTFSPPGVWTETPLTDAQKVPNHIIYAGQNSQNGDSVHIYTLPARGSLPEMTQERVAYQIQWLNEVDNSPPKYSVNNSRKFSSFEVTGKYKSNGKPLFTIQELYQVSDGFISIAFFSNRTSISEVRSEFNAGLTSVKIKTKNQSGETINNIDNTKNKCKELGFKTGTEDFGKCVLQLSK